MFLLSDFAPVGFVSRNFCTEVFFLLNSRQDMRIMPHTTICNTTFFCNNAVIEHNQSELNCVGTNLLWVDNPSAQIQYLFTVSCFYSAFAEQHDKAIFMEEILLVRKGKPVTILTHPYQQTTCKYERTRVNFKPCICMQVW